MAGVKSKTDFNDDDDMRKTFTTSFCYQTCIIS